MSAVGSTRQSVTGRQRWNRGLWIAFGIVLVAQLWPVRTLGSRIEPSIAGMPFTVTWHVVAVTAWIIIYLLWMTKVWNPAADDLDVRPAEDQS